MGPKYGGAYLARRRALCPYPNGQKRLFFQLKNSCGERLWNKPKPNRGLLLIQDLFPTRCRLFSSIGYKILNLVNSLSQNLSMRVIWSESLSRIKIPKIAGITLEARPFTFGHRVNEAWTNS